MKDLTFEEFDKGIGRSATYWASKETNETKEMVRKKKIEGFYSKYKFIKHEAMIVTPGLYKIFETYKNDFEYHLEDKKPIIVLGDTGVGKSLFLRLSKELFRNKYSHKKKHPINTINCAHFEKQLARSELFGHVKGAFTGAVQKTIGWIEKSNNGLLILEEVGELSKEVQAELLTFLDTKEFHKVGSTKIDKSSVQIVAATNRTDDLREDFFYRFFPYKIPPLYTRRNDVLFYLALLFGDSIESLSLWEVMTLLAHNWPGNIREVERVGRLLYMRKGNKFNKLRGISGSINLEEIYKK
jgi:transcriptional regulator with GAF, ATPase, and Fis domain